MRSTNRRYLAVLWMILMTVASAGCGPQETEPVPEAPTAEPGTVEETPAPVQENPAAEQREVSAQMPPEWLPVPSNMGKASSRR